MSKRLKQQLVVKQKTQLRLKPRLIITGSTLAIAVLFGMGLFMYGNFGNNTESLAAKKKTKTVTTQFSAPDGPMGINAVCTDNKTELTWNNNTGSENKSQTDGIVILKRNGIVTANQTINDFEMDATGKMVTDVSSLNGWEMIYNGNLTNSFTDEGNVKGIFTYLIYEKAGGIKCTAAENAGRIFVFNGSNLSETLSTETAIDGLYLPSSCTLTVDDKSLLTIRKGTVLGIGGTFVLKGQMEDNASAWTFNEGAQFVYECNGSRKNAIPAAEWKKGSTCMITGMENKEPHGLNQSFADFTWNCKNQTSDASAPDNFTVKGNMKILSTGKQIKAFAFKGTSYFSGDVFIDNSSARIEVKGKSEMMISGSAAQTLTGNWKLQTLTVNNPSTVTLCGEITVTKKLNIENGTIQLSDNNSIKSVFNIANEAVINRANGTLAFAPVFSGRYDLNYLAPCTTGEELTENNSTLANLTINCEGEVVLNKNASINSSLQLINGIIVTGDFEVVMRDNSPKAIKEFSSSSYVAGNLRRMVNGKSTYEFPVGTRSNMEAITVNLNGTGGFNSLLAKFNSEKQSNSAITAGTRLNGSLVSNFLNNGYWTLTPNGDMTSGSYSVKLSSKGQTNSAPAVGCYAVMSRKDKSFKWNFSGKHSMKTQSVNQGVVTAARSNVNSFGDFAVAFSDVSILLSKSFLNVSLINHQHTDVTWRTDAEMNLPSLVLQRSPDAVHFDNIGEMKEGKEKNNMQEFTFRDSQPLAGVSYYRVKQTDMDGTVSYSDIRFIDNTSVVQSSNR